jgi:hypothetical protein
MKQAGLLDVSERRKKRVKTRDFLARVNRFSENALLAARVTASRRPFDRRLRVFVRTTAGDGVIAIGRLGRDKNLFQRTAHDDPSKRLVGLVHARQFQAVGRRGDFVAKRLPRAFGTKPNCRLSRRVVTHADRQDLGLFPRHHRRSPPDPPRGARAASSML